MTKIQGFVRRHPLLSYVLLVFAISWGGILIVLANGGFTPGGAEGQKQFLLMYLAMLLGPGLAGVLLAGVIYGRVALRAHVTQMLRVRVGARWYAAALLIAPLAI